MEANPKYIRDVLAVLGLEEATFVTTPSVKKDANDRINLLSLRTKDDHVQNCCVKTVVHVSGTSRHHVQRERDSTKNYLSDRE